MTNELRHTPKLRLLSAFLAVAMALTMFPAAAFAEDATDYKLTVNGTNVTSANATDILGDGTAKHEGSVLTLNGEITVHYTVTFNLNGGTDWGKNGDWIELAGGKWNDSRDQVSFTTHSFTTQTGSIGEGLSINVETGMGPKREDYEFVGWYTARNGGEPVEKQPYYAQVQRLEPITENITLYAHWQWIGEGPEPDPVPAPDETVVDGGDSSGFGAVLAVAGGAAVVGAAGFGIYELATRAILKDLLPEGAAIPATRGELALLLWQNAGKPEPAALSAFADTADAETAKAAQWCTEQGLLTAEDGAFHPEQKVTKYRVIRVWKQAAAPQQ